MRYRIPTDAAGYSSPCYWRLVGPRRGDGAAADSDVAHVVITDAGTEIAAIKEVP